MQLYLRYSSFDHIKSTRYTTYILRVKKAQYNLVNGGLRKYMKIQVFPEKLFGFIKPTYRAMGFLTI